MVSEKKQILILDSTGMAGHMISRYLSSLGKYEIINLKWDDSSQDHISTANIYDTVLFRELIIRKSPDIIINCVRLLVEESDHHPDKAIYFNSYLPHYLSKIAREIGAKVIQLSTDCVFSGEKGNYSEDDIRDGTNVYARSKALGELENNIDITIRTSFIGPNINQRSEELFHWFLLQEGEINGYSRAFWTGITTLELAKSIDKLLDMDFSGLYHLVPDEKISKYELLVLIKNIWKKDIIINEDDSVIADKSLADNNRIIRTEDYATMFKELNQWMNENKDLYQIYF